MKTFMLLHYGFVEPTPEIMAEWGKWFEAIEDRMVDIGGRFSAAREISHAGAKDLPMGTDSITGYTIINADSLDEAAVIAGENPFIASIRVYEIMTK